MAAQRRCPRIVALAGRLQSRVAEAQAPSSLLPTLMHGLSRAYLSLLS